jgi:hypothetical protein
MSLRAAVGCALAVIVAACQPPIYTLVPTPYTLAAAGRPLPVSVRVANISVTRGLAQPGAAFGPGSRIAIELEVRNGDAARPAVIGRASLVVRDALGGPEVWAGEVDDDKSGVSPMSYRPRNLPPPPTGPLMIPPGATVTVWRVFAGFPPHGPSGPLRATVFVPVQGQPPLAVVIADPVPGGPRWTAPPRGLAMYLTGGTGVLGAHHEFYDPAGVSWRGSSGRFIWGIDYRLTARHRELAGGSLGDFGFSMLGDVQWQPWHLPGLYLEGGAFLADERSGGRSRGEVLLPRVSAGLVLGGGRMPPETLFPVQRPPSAQRRAAARIGYTQWFNTGDGWGAGGIELSIEAMTLP